MEEKDKIGKRRSRASKQASERKGKKTR